ncbi:MAG: hypothetical protein ACI9TH_004340, partial [Kiritimatiellia bacterium]
FPPEAPREVQNVRKWATHEAVPRGIHIYR